MQTRHQSAARAGWLASSLRSRRGQRNLFLFPKLDLEFDSFVGEEDAAQWFLQVCHEYFTVGKVDEDDFMYRGLHIRMVKLGELTIDYDRLR